jgi:copper chaperone NosL
VWLSPGAFLKPTIMKKLSIVSRILVAFASGALIAVFFLPAWRIDLFAPQYPEGLTMNIWIHGLSGDVDIINGLNHYIGMKHITEDMFPEFTYLPYVVGFFMILGMVVAITGNRKFLFAYLVLTVIGGALAIYDFYQWSYDYGHNLDPMAPIQVPGLSYQPPLFGHKRLLNFDAYSFPHVGGWIVIGAGLLAGGVWFVEWYRHRTKKPGKIKPSAALVPAMLLLLMASCNTKPQPFEMGKDVCHFCKMTITDTRFGGELVTKKGKIYKFDDLHCMAEYLNTDKETTFSHSLTIDFEKPNTFIETAKANFVISPDLKSPMGSNAAAFMTNESAQAIGKSSEVLTWAQLLEKLK